MGDFRFDGGNSICTMVASVILCTVVFKAEALFDTRSIKLYPFPIPPE